MGRSGRFYATINASATGNTTVVAAVTGARIRVYGLFLTHNATVALSTFQFTDGAGGTALTGTMGSGVIALPTTLSMPESDAGYFATSAGNALVLAIAGGTAPFAQGFLVYETER